MATKKTKSNDSILTSFIKIAYKTIKATFSKKKGKRKKKKKESFSYNFSHVYITLAFIPDYKRKICPYIFFTLLLFILFLSMSITTRASPAYKVDHHAKSAWLFFLDFRLKYKFKRPLNSENNHINS